MMRIISFILIWGFFIPLAVVWDTFFFVVRLMFILLVTIDHGGGILSSKLKDWYDSIHN